MISVIGQIAGSWRFFRYDAMADIDLHFLALGDLKQQYLELELRAGRPLIYGSEWFWNIIFHIWMVWNRPIFSSCLFLSAYDFFRDFISMLVLLWYLFFWSLVPLIWPDLIRSDDISLLRSDLVFSCHYCSLSAGKYYWWTLWWWFNVCNDYFRFWLWICALSEANFVMTTS